MAIDVFSLFARLSLDTTEYTSSLSNAMHGMKNLGTFTQSSISLIKDVWATGTRAAVDMGKSFISAAADTASYGDNIDKLSQQMGLSAEAYQEWEAIMQHSGTSMETLKAGMKTLANAVENGNVAFDRLGITQEQIAGMDNEELFSATIAALQNVENETERTYLAGQLLGRGATELGALLNTSSEKTEAMRQRVHDLGGVMSDEAVKASAAFQDNLQDLQTAFSGIKHSIAADFLPGLNSIIEGFTALITGSDNATQLISDGAKILENSFSSSIDDISEKIRSFDPHIASAVTNSFLRVTESVGSLLTSVADTVIDQIPTVLPIMVDGGIQLFSGLFSGINDLADNVAEILPDTVGKISSAFSENAPIFVDLGAQLLVTIADGIAQNTETVVTAFTSVIPSLIDSASETLPLLMDAGIQIVQGICSGISENFTAIYESALNLLTTFSGYIFENLPALLESGAQMLSTIVTGISKHLPDLVSSAGELIKSFVNFTAKNFPSLLETGRELLVSIASGVVNSLPQLAQTAFEMIGSLVNFTLDNLPLILDTATTLVLTLVDGLTNNLPAIADGAGELIGKLTSTITKNLPNIIQKGFEVTSKLATGLINALPKIVSSAVTLIGSLALELTKYDWLSLGKNIIWGIKDGVVSFGGDLITAILNTAGNAFDAVKRFFGIASPSKLMRDEIGKYIPAGIAEGITAYKDDISNAMSEVAKITSSYPLETNIGAITAKHIETVNGINDPYTTAHSSDVKNRIIPETAVFEIYLDGNKLSQSAFPYIDVMLGAQMRQSERGIANY